MQTTAPTSSTNGSTYFEKNDEEGKEEGEEFMPTGNSFFTPKTPLFTDDNENKTLSPKITRSQTSFETPSNIKSEFKNTKLEKLYTIIKTNPFEFGVSEKGKILNNLHQPIDKSDLKLSLERIINRNVSNAPSPVGTTYLERKLRKNPETLKIIESKNQYGFGRKLIKYKIERKNTHFKPALWTKN